MKATLRPLVRAELVQRRRMLAALGVATFVFFLALTGTYQALGGAEELAGSFVRTPSFFSALAGSREQVNIFAPANFLAFGFVHPLFLVLTMSVALSLGTAAVAGDIESGRAEIVFTAPMRRTAVLDARIWLWAATQATVVLAAGLGALVGMRLSPDLGALGVAPIVRMLAQYVPLIAFVGALSFAASAVTRTRGQALGVAVGATVLGYLVNFVALLWDPLDPLRRISPFAYYVPARAAAAIDVGDAVVLLAATAVLLALAHVALARRDLA